MPSLVTILTIPFPGNVSIIQARLESEGIECFTKDDTTIQIDPLISNAVGGIKLQVKEDDVEKALEILYSQGYLTRESVENPDSYSGLKKLAAQLPFFKKLRFEMRLLVWFLILFAILSAAILWIAMPNTSERLAENSWCVDRIVYNGKAYTPNSTGIRLSGPLFCNESIIFNNNGDLTLPGFNCNSIKGTWGVEGKWLTIDNIDTFKFVYKGSYEVIFYKEQLVLQSDKTTIYCSHL